MMRTRIHDMFIGELIVNDLLDVSEDEFLEEIKLEEVFDAE